MWPGDREKSQLLLRNRKNLPEFMRSGTSGGNWRLLLYPGSARATVGTEPCAGPQDHDPSTRQRALPEASRRTERSNQALQAVLGIHRLEAASDDTALANARANQEPHQDAWGGKEAAAGVVWDVSMTTHAAGFGDTCNIQYCWTLSSTVEHPKGRTRRLEWCIVYKVNGVTTFSVDALIINPNTCKTKLKLRTSYRLNIDWYGCTIRQRCCYMEGLIYYSTAQK